MAKLKRPNGRLGRLFFKLVDADYEIFHIAGVENHLPDFLSRAFPEPTEVMAII